VPNLAAFYVPLLEHPRDGKPIAVEIYVAEVLPDGQAKEAGLMEGDVLVSYDGKAVRNEAEIPAWVRTPGDTPREFRPIEKAYANLLAPLDAPI
jgi:S1-C subfamily serine protease